MLIDDLPAILLEAPARLSTTQCLLLLVGAGRTVHRIVLSNCAPSSSMETFLSTANTIEYEKICLFASVSVQAFAGVQGSVMAFECVVRRLLDAQGHCSAIVLSLVLDFAVSCRCCDRYAQVRCKVQCRVSAEVEM